MPLSLLQSVTGRILVESHRGSDHGPENSWPAIQAAHRLGADLIEMDVHLSRDEVPFLRHNYSLPDGRWGQTLDWAELATITVQGEPLPRLEDVLFWAREVDAYLSLDLKGGFIAEGRLCRAVVELLQRTKTVERVMLISWDHVDLAAAKQACPELTTRCLIRARLADLSGMLQSAQVDAVSLSYDLVRPTEVEQAHALGVAVVLAEMWQPDFEYARQLGVDVVSWGDPVEARALV